MDYLGRKKRSNRSSAEAVIVNSGPTNGLSLTPSAIDISGM